VQGIGSQYNENVCKLRGGSVGLSVDFISCAFSPGAPKTVPDLVEKSAVIKIVQYQTLI
jgi:hypothetical protein